MNIIQNKEGWYGIEQDTHVWQWICDSGRLDHDRHIIPIIEDILKPGMIAIDAGALYGDHAIAYARSVGSEGAVICIEANPLAFECLSKNAEKFQSTIVLLNVVLGEEHGTTAIHTMQEATQVNVGASRVNTFSDKKENTSEKEIPTASIDGIVMNADLRNGVNFIKYDIEGWEYKALLGSKGTLQHPKNKPVLLIEINKGALESQGATDRMIYDFLLEMNYAWRIVQPDCHGNSPQFDILAWPNQIEKPKIVSG